MQALTNLLNNVIELDENLFFQRLFDINKYREYVISRNTWGQLFDKGVDAKGRPVGTYSYNSVNIKGGVKQDGTPFSAGERYTFRDSGKFFNSFRLNSYYGFLEIDADPLEGEVPGLRNEQDLLGLTEESKEELTQYILQEGDLVNDIKEKILQYD